MDGWEALAGDELRTRIEQRGYSPEQAAMMERKARLGNTEMRRLLDRL